MNPVDPIRMADFADFCLTSGMGQVTCVRELRRGRSEHFDFYRPVREGILSVLRGDTPDGALDLLLGRTVDPRERRIFPKVVVGFRKFMRARTVQWFEPALRDYHLAGPISVRVAPEVGAIINGQPHMLKLYMRGDPLLAQKALLLNTLLSAALAPAWPHANFGVLDVRRAKLYPWKPSKDALSYLRAGATAMGSLWDVLP